MRSRPKHSGSRRRKSTSLCSLRLPEPTLAKSGPQPTAGGLSLEPERDGFGVISRSGDQYYVRSRDGWRCVSTHWLKEATDALESGQTDRTLELIERHALRRNASLSDMREAYVLAKRIEDGRGPDAVKMRAGRATSHLSSYVDPLGVANLERNRKAREAEDSAQTQARKAELRAMGLSPQRVDALAQLQGGPYEVVLTGLTGDCDRQVIQAVLEKVGFPRTELKLLLERVEHIAPEPIAQLVHQSAAVRIKVALEAAGAKVRIRTQKWTV